MTMSDPSPASSSSTSVAEVAPKESFLRDQLRASQARERALQAALEKEKRTLRPTEEYLGMVWLCSLLFLFFAFVIVVCAAFDDGRVETSRTELGIKANVVYFAALDLIEKLAVMTKNGTQIGKY